MKLLFGWLMTIFAFTSAGCLAMAVYLVLTTETLTSTDYLILALASVFLTQVFKTLYNNGKDNQAQSSLSEP